MAGVWGMTRYLTSTHWGAYWVETDKGTVSRITAFDEDVDPSPIGPGMRDTFTDDLRIRRPAVRARYLAEGPHAQHTRRGDDEFVEVSWETALRLVADELNRVRQNFGNQAIFGGSYGWASAGRFHHAQSQLHRFLNSVGGYTRSKNTYSFAAAEVMMPHVLGGFREFLYPGSFWQGITEHADIVLAFGGIPLKNGQIAQGGTGRHRQKEALEQALSRGVQFINVSPLAEDIPAHDKVSWLPIRPGTDTAMILALCEDLIRHGNHDQEFLNKYCVGSDALIAYILGETDGQVKNAAWAADICGVDENDITNLARQLVGQNVMISASWSLTRQEHGEQPFWAAIALASMIGQIGRPGCGISLGLSATNAVGLEFAPVAIQALPQGSNPVTDFIPVARISDMLLNPGDSFAYNGSEYRYPDIKLMYWAGGNPFHHHQDLARMQKAWDHPETIIVHEWCWNASARHADIVLPVTTFMERDDIAITPRDPYILLMDKVMEPVGEAQDDFTIFSQIAELMGCHEHFTEGRTEKDWIRWIYDQSRSRSADIGVNMPEFEVLEKNRWIKISHAQDYTQSNLHAFRENPKGSALNTPSGRIELFSQQVHNFGLVDCLGHPSWLTPREWLGSPDLQDQLHLISHQPKGKLHSQFDHGAYSKSFKKFGREVVLIHPDDATDRGIKDDDYVLLHNQRGQCLAVAQSSKNVRRGVLVMATGAWFDPWFAEGQVVGCTHGNPNILTQDIGTSSLAQGPSAQSCLVRIEVFNGVCPPVQVFEKPKLRQSL